MTDTPYNGWANYATWAVKLWIDNDQGDYEYWREHTRLVWDTAEADGPLSREASARLTLADRLEDQHGTDRPYEAPNPTGVYHDLLSHALNSVDWREIAKSMLSDLREELGWRPRVLSELREEQECEPEIATTAPGATE